MLPESPFWDKLRQGIEFVCSGKFSNQRFSTIPTGRIPSFQQAHPQQRAPSWHLLHSTHWVPSPFYREKNPFLQRKNSQNNSRNLLNHFPSFRKTCGATETWSLSSRNTYQPSRGCENFCFLALYLTSHRAACPGTWWCYWQLLHSEIEEENGSR